MFKILHIISWVYLGLTSLLLMLTGLTVVPIALLWGVESVDWPKIFWLWGNDEENVPNWWLNRQHFLPNFWWYAVRNPINNSRFLVKEPTKFKIETNWDSPLPMEADYMRSKGVTEVYRWVYSGIFAGYRKVWLNPNGTYGEFWAGWKIGSRVPGMGFTMQYRNNREIGT